MGFLTGIPFHFPGGVGRRKSCIIWTFPFRQGGQSGHSRTKGEGLLSAFQPVPSPRKFQKLQRSLCQKVIQRTGRSGVKQADGVVKHLRKRQFLYI